MLRLLLVLFLICFPEIDLNNRDVGKIVFQGIPTKQRLFVDFGKPGFGNHGFESMIELDSDDVALTDSNGTPWSRDIVQFTKFDRKVDFAYMVCNDVYTNILILYFTLCIE